MQMCVLCGDDVFCVCSKLYGDQARFFESEKMPRIKHRKKGTVSMVNNGSDQHGSQVNCAHIYYTRVSIVYGL